jgi:alkylation response protein AidB-like acyl-CoA dehydrogenase
MSAEVQLQNAPSEVQLALGDSADRYLSKNYDFDQRQKFLDSGTGFNREVWSAFSDLGWLAVPFPEENGGIGGGVGEFNAIMPAMGRALVLEPYLDAVVLAGTLLSLTPSSPVRDQLIESTITGEAFATLALLGARQRIPGNGTHSRLHSRDGGWEIIGEHCLVPFAEQAEMILVPACHTESSQGAISICAVRPSEAEIRSYTTLDGSQAADLVMHGVKLPPERIIASPEIASTALKQALRVATLSVCVEAIAIMEVVIEQTVEYLKTRKQFGQALAQFQALRHTVADMAIQLGTADGAVWMACQQINSDNEKQVDLLLAAAKREIGRAGRFIGGRAIQLHGGIGMTDECIIGHYFKRLVMLNLLYGGESYQLQRISELQRLQ